MSEIQLFRKKKVLELLSSSNLARRGHHVGLCAYLFECKKGRQKGCSERGLASSTTNQSRSIMSERRFAARDL